jgi:hypothetical protein
VVLRQDQRSSPELYLRDLLPRFFAAEPDTVRADLAALADFFAQGQLEDALIELLGVDPGDACAALLRWKATMEADGTAPALARRRLDTVRRLCVLAEASMEASLVAFVVERHGATLAQMLERALRSNAPN